MSDFKPLGPPIRPEKPGEPERWEARDPSKPHIQTSSKTGRMRNTTPPPSEAGPPYWYFVPMP
jgi:hypothetical protein